MRQFGNLKILSFLFSFALISCHHEYKKVISFYPNSNKPKAVLIYPDKKDSTIFWKAQYYENGQLKFKGLVKNNLKEGVWQWWYNNGIPSDSETFSHNQCIKTIKHWWPNGKIEEVCYLNHDKYYCCNEDDNSGLYKDYDRLGRIKREYVILNNKVNGTSTSYYYGDNDLIKTMQDYNSGIPEGKRIEWYKDNKRVEGQYKDGKEEGIWHLFKNDKLFRIDNYKAGKRVSKQSIDTLATNTAHQ